MNIATLLNPQDAGNQSAIALANLSSAIASLRNRQSLTNRIVATPQASAAEAREDTQEQSISHALDSIDMSLQQLTQAQRANKGAIRLLLHRSIPSKTSIVSLTSAFATRAIPAIRLKFPIRAIRILNLIFEENRCETRRSPHSRLLDWDCFVVASRKSTFRSSRR